MTMQAIATITQVVIMATRTRFWMDQARTLPARCP